MYATPVLVAALIGLAITLVVVWIALAIAVLVGQHRGGGIAAPVGFVPKVARLVWALARDPSVPRSARWRLWVAFAYNVQPINLIPDFVPVVGLVDNIVVLAWAVRHTMRHTSSTLVAERWTGSQEELDLLYRLARVPGPG